VEVQRSLSSLRSLSWSSLSYYIRA